MICEQDGCELLATAMVEWGAMFIRDYPLRLVYCDEHTAKAQELAASEPSLDLIAHVVRFA